MKRFKTNILSKYLCRKRRRRFVAYDKIKSRDLIPAKDTAEQTINKNINNSIVRTVCVLVTRTRFELV